MSEQIVVKGLIIKQTDFSESDRYITVLTADLGRIEVLCRGVRRRRGRFVQAVSLFAYSELALYANRGGRYTLNDAETDMQFWELTADPERYALACYFAELAGLAAEADDCSPELLPMMLRALYALSRQNRPTDIVKPAFELRLAAMLGYAPDLSVCAACGAEEAPSFLLEEGALMCDNCRSRIGGTYFRLAGGTLDAMRYILTCPERRLFGFSLSGAALEQLDTVCERYLLHHLDIRCSTLDYYHSLSSLTASYTKQGTEPSSAPTENRNS